MRVASQFVFPRQANTDGRLLKWYGQTVDIEDLKRAENLLAAERTVLEMLAKSASLGATLDVTCRMVDEMLPGCTSSVWLLGDDDSTVTDFVAPGLPRAFIEDLTNAMQAMPAGGVIHVRLNMMAITTPLILTTTCMPTKS